MPLNACSLGCMPPKPKSKLSHPSHPKRLSYRRTQSYIADLFSFLTAHPLIAITRMIHAIRKVITPIETVNINIASKSWSSRVFIVSWAYHHPSVFIPFYYIISEKMVLTLAIKIIPPAIKQNAVINSVGGRPGKIDVGGER
jgi:hypothetical protein